MAHAPFYCTECPPDHQTKDRQVQLALTKVAAGVFGQGGVAFRSSGAGPAVWRHRPLAYPFARRLGQLNMGIGAPKTAIRRVLEPDLLGSKQMPGLGGLCGQVAFVLRSLTNAQRHAFGNRNA